MLSYDVPLKLSHITPCFQMQKAGSCSMACSIAKDSAVPVLSSCPVTKNVLEMRDSLRAIVASDLLQSNLPSVEVRSESHVSINSGSD